MFSAAIDDVRKYWNSRPCNIRHSRAAMGTKQYFDEVEVRKYFVELLADFKVVSIKKDHIFPYIVEKYVKHEYERVWYFRYLPAPVFRALERMAGWHMLIVAQAKAPGR